MTTISEVTGMMPLFDALDELDARIRQEDIALDTLKAGLGSIDRDIKLAEIDKMFEVARMKGADGKPKYPNEAQRKAAVDKHLGDDREYRILIDLRVKQMHALKSAEAWRDSYSRRHSALIAMAQSRGYNPLVKMPATRTI